MNDKKRKFKDLDVVSRLNGTYEKAPLELIIPEFMACETGQKPIFNYQSSNSITCSCECFSAWKLNKQSTFLDENPSGNPTKMLKRPQSAENIDMIIEH